MSNIGAWHLAAASNNATPPDGWPEGQAPSTVNNCAREMMSSIRRQWDDAVWFNFYPTTSPSTYISLKAQNKIRISNQSAATTYTATDIYPIGTRLKVMNANVNKYGSVASLSSSSTAVILTMTMDSGTLTSTITTVSRSIITPNNSPIPSANTFTAATKAQQEAGSSNVVVVTPAVQQYHDSGLKFWCIAGTNGTIVEGYNVTSVGDTGTGIVTITYTVNTTVNGGPVGGAPNNTVGGSAASTLIVNIRPFSGATGFIADCVNLSSFAGTDPGSWFFIGAGVQA